MQNVPTETSRYTLTDALQDLCGFGGAALVGYGGEVIFPGAGYVAAGLLLFYLSIRG